MSDVLKADMGALWIQRTPGGVPEYVACLDLDDIAEPQGDNTISLCRDPNGKYKTVGRSKGAPGAPTTSITAWIYPEKNVLDEIIAVQCPVTIYALSRTCGRADIFDNYVRGRVLLNATITNVSDMNIVKRIETGEQAVKIDFSADFPISRVRTVTATRQTIAESAALNDVAFCDSSQCAGACGAQSDAGEEGFAVASPQSGSPGPTSNIWHTTNGGTWSVGATDPFAAAEDILSGVCFDIDTSTKRKLVAREKNPTKAAQVAYSDNNGTTWTDVTVGSVYNEGAADAGALFALDMYHIWFATDTGRIYKSTDGGVSWTLLDALTASAGKALNAVWFADANNGWVVGEDGKILKTADGGETWATAVDDSGGDDYKCVFAWDQNRAIAGTNAGALWQTWDGGANWTEQTYPAAAATDTVQDVQFVNAAVGFMISDTSGPVGRAYRTINGGNDWKAIVVPSNAGFNALSVINENLAYVVGNAEGGSAVVLVISG